MNRLPILFILALLLSGCIFDKDKEDSGYYSTQSGPRSASKGIYRNTELGYSLAYPKTWEGGLLKFGDAVAYWSSDTGIAYVTVYECPVDSAYFCEFFQESDRTYGVTETRQGVEVVVDFSTDTTNTRITGLQRIHFQRGNKIMMLWMYGSLHDFDGNSDFKRIDSSLTFF